MAKSQEEVLRENWERTHPGAKVPPPKGKSNGFDLGGPASGYPKGSTTDLLTQAAVEYGKNRQANWQRETPARTNRAKANYQQPETQNATAGKAKSKAAASKPTPTRATYEPKRNPAPSKRTPPAAKGTTANGGTRGGVNGGRPASNRNNAPASAANNTAKGNAQTGKAQSTRAQVARVFASTEEAAKRGAAGQPLRTKEEKGKYISGADYKAWKTAQDQARLAAKKKGK